MRRMRHAIPCVAGAVLLSNCYFFEAELDDCLGLDASERSGCPNAGAPNSGGGNDSSGGRIGYGGDAAGGASGGRRGSGGRNQAGGAPMQSASGGEGGDQALGGQGGAAGTPNSELVSQMKLNEVRETSYGFVEIYNPTDEVVAFAGLRLGLLGKGATKYRDQCDLGGLADIEAKGFALIAGMNFTACPISEGEDQLPCMSCGFQITTGDLISILELQEERLVPLLSLKYPESSTTDTRSSWAAFPDGSDNYQLTEFSTPGASND